MIKPKKLGLVHEKDLNCRSVAIIFINCLHDTVLLWKTLIDNIIQPIEFTVKLPLFWLWYAFVCHFYPILLLLSNGCFLTASYLFILKFS